MNEGRKEKMWDRLGREEGREGAEERNVPHGMMRQNQKSHAVVMHGVLRCNDVMHDDDQVQG